MKKTIRIGMCVVVLTVLLANVGVAAEKHTILILTIPITERHVEQVLQALEQAGFVDQQNVTVVRVPVSAADDPAQLAARVQAADVVVNFVPFKSVHNLFESLSIPVISYGEVERFVNAEGVPTANVTGVYSTLPDIVYNSYKFLRKATPLKAGQQVVFLDNTMAPLISAEEAEDALHRLQIPIKAVVDASLIEDWQEAILRYNDDPDVGWILMGLPPSRRRDGSQMNYDTEVVPWMREHLQKPTVTYWERGVRWGALCGFGIDGSEAAVQVGEMAAQVLHGEDVRTINAQYPRKVSISLNRKTATKLGIVFSMDILDLANVIYDDYEGKQVIRK